MTSARFTQGDKRPIQFDATEYSANATQRCCEVTNYRHRSRAGEQAVHPTQVDSSPSLRMLPACVYTKDCRLTFQTYVIADLFSVASLKTALIDVIFSYSSGKYLGIRDVCWLYENLLKNDPLL